MRLKNTLSFYELYKVKISKEVQSNNVLDIWIILRCNELLKEVEEAMHQYQLDKALRPIEKFIEDLSLWYLRRSRGRLRNEGTRVQEEALATFHIILLQLSKICAPFIPFTSEGIYQELESKNKESVHLEEWPTSIRVTNNSELISDMNLARKITSLALEARSQLSIKVRQPLNSLTIKDASLKNKENILNLIKEEVNIKEIVFDSNLQSDVKLDTYLTNELREEGVIRDIIRLNSGRS